jgi:multidrug efflux pump subunit AcrA (membrane-fusion protein)
MLAQIRLSTADRSDALMVPRSAIQAIGDHTVVYVADPLDPTRFVEREVAVDETADGEMVRLLSGVTVGDVIVSKGSFSLRAERERLGLPPQP